MTVTPVLKIVTIVGARPQFIKAAPVSRAIQQRNREDRGRKISEIMVHTGQHYDHNMSRVFFEELEIPEPHYNLGVGSGSHGKMTGAMLERIEDVLIKEQPDFILVYGDTNSTLAGGLAAVKLHIPVAHVEAGLRSFNRRMPEEINRVLADHISTILFCPTKQAIENLKVEGIVDADTDHEPSAMSYKLPQKVALVGDVMYDAALYYRKKAIRPDREGAYALATLHREENTEDPLRLRSILSAMGDSPVPVLLPLHPRTRKLLNQNHISVNSQVEIVDPISYFSMLGHLQNCMFVMTDSGGLQKEAYFFHKKCITLRDETEWTELVDCEANRVVGAEEPAIRGAFSWAMQPLSDSTELYGKGNAGVDIVRHLVEITR